MLNKLRRKIILTCMLMVGALVVLGLSAIFIADKLHERHNVEQYLDKSINQVNDRLINMSYNYDSFYYSLYDIKKFQMYSEGIIDTPVIQQKDDSEDKISEENNRKYIPPEIGVQEDEDLYDIPSTVYTVSKNGSLHFMPGNESTAHISNEVIKKATPYVAIAEEGMHELPDYDLVFKKMKIDNVMYAAFTDIAFMSTWKILAVMFVIVGFCTIIFLLIVSLILSRYIVKPVKESWSSQQRFVADVSHDLKTPISVISANTAILKTNPQASFSDQEQWIVSTEEETNRMLTLINRMLTLAKIEDPAARKETIQKAFTVFNFSVLVEEIALQFESLAYDNNAVMDINISPDLFIFANFDNIRTMIGTLLENSCKYAGIYDVITVSLTKHSNHAVFSVNNAKSYINEEDLENIFNRFYRSDKSRTTTNNSQGGHGLGLAIALAICNEVGGTLEAESNKEQGTTFTAQIPLSKQHRKTTRN